MRMGMNIRMMVERGVRECSNTRLPGRTASQIWPSPRPTGPCSAPAPSCPRRSASTGVESYGWSVLYVGKIGLAGILAHGQKTTRRLMREAAATGQFVGARITTRHLA